MKFSNTLILVITRRCNARCKYCSVEKADIAMTPDVARKATSIFFQHVSPGKGRVKFFGGEPLLEFDLISRLIKDIRAAYGNVHFTIPTGAVVLTDDAHRFFKENHGIELMVNLDAFRQAHRHPRSRTRTLKSFLELPDAGITITISPRAVDKFSEQFMKLAGMGFRKFNFLPAYYQIWSHTQIEMLRMEFSLVNKFIAKASRAGTCFDIKNITARGDIPLFNSAVTVDCNGDIFFTNLFLSTHFSHLRDMLNRGSINSPESIVWNRKDDCQTLIKKHLPRGVYSATMAVDESLSEFVLSRSL